MLEIGNGVLTKEEEETHFALWALAKAPLLVGADLSTLSDESKAVLTNQHLIGINQDKLGNQAECVMNCDYSKPASAQQVWQSLVISDDVTGLEMALVAVNWDDATPFDFNLDLVALGIASKPQNNCTIKDLWTGDVTYTNGGV
jgi:hypothetical protein